MQVGIRSRQPRVVLDLLGKAPAVAPGDGWGIHYALFAHSGFTPTARQAGEGAGRGWWTWRCWTPTWGWMRPRGSYESYAD